MSGNVSRKIADRFGGSAKGRANVMIMGYVMCMIIFCAVDILFKPKLSPYFDVKGEWLDMGRYMLIYTPWDIFPGYVLRGISPGYDVPTFSIQALAIIFINALVEEVEFRVFPITLASFLLMRCSASRERGAAVLLAVMISGSAFFGYIHGGTDHIFVQGALGLIWSFVYMICGGMIAELKGIPAVVSIAQALLSVTLIHTLYNYSGYVYYALAFGLSFVNFGP